MDAAAPDSAADLGTQRLIGATLAAGLVAAGVALLLFTWLGREVLQGATEPLDIRLREALHSFASPHLTRIMVGASVLGAPSRLAPLGLVVAGLFLVRGWSRGALLVVVTLAGASLLDLLLKQLYGRIRPEAFFDYYPSPASFSFPSGHTLFATCFFGGLAVLLAARVRSSVLRVVVWAGALATIALIGISRIYLGVHYPSDVVGGFAAGITWTTAVALGDRMASHRRAHRAG
jgi:membrane-associated phospholipid phosphatase